MDAMLRDELAAILAEAPPPVRSASELAFAAVDNSPRAIQERAIIRIANRFHWHDAITHFLDMKGAAYLSDLTSAQIDDLRDRMDGFVDAAECGHSLPDCLPAN